MNDFVNQSGWFDVVIGRGRISLSEIASLKTGSLVTVSDRVTGSPVDLMFNGSTLSHGQIECVDKTLMLRLAFNDWSPDELPHVPVRDDVSQIISSEIRMAHVEGKLSDLAGIGEYGLVNLGIPMEHDRKAELVAGGQVVATGTAGFTGESWALTVDEVKCGVADGGEHYSTGAVPVLNRKPVHRYDWGRPDMFSKQQLRVAHDVHRLFLHNVHSLVQAEKVSRIDQMQLAEAVDGMGEGQLFRVTSDASARRASEPGTAHFAQLTGAVLTVDDQVARRLGRHAERMDRSFGLDDTVICVAGGSISEPARLASAFRNAWRTQTRVPGMSIEPIARAELVPEPLQANQMILLAEVSTAADESKIVLLYPAHNLLKIVRGLR